MKNIKDTTPPYYLLQNALSKAYNTLYDEKKHNAHLLYF